MIDGKNTLQSFDDVIKTNTDNNITTNDNNIASTNKQQQQTQHEEQEDIEEVSSKFILPTGDVMDGKNTLQSFDNIPNMNHNDNDDINSQPPPSLVQVPSSVMATPIITTSANPNPNDDVVEMNQNVIIHAEVVQSFVVAEVEPISSKRSASFWMIFCFGIILIAIVGGVGAYLVIMNQSSSSSGNNNDSNNDNTSSSSSSNDNNNTNTNQRPTTSSTVTPTPMIPPSVVPPTPITFNATTLASLKVACNFLNYTNITFCSNIKVYDGKPVGSTIPTEIGLLTQLDGLGLYFSQLTGTIPSSLGNLVNLISLDLSSNQLNGTIPSSLGNLVNLNYLDLSTNQLTGSIPSSFDRLTLLNSMYLYNNTQLQGTISYNLCSLIELSGNIIIDCNNFECPCCSTYETNINIIPCPLV